MPETTPHGWLLAAAVFLAILGLKLIYLHYKAKKQLKLKTFEKQIAQTNDVDDLIDILSVTRDKAHKQIIERKLYQITHR